MEDLMLARVVNRDRNLLGFVMWSGSGWAPYTIYYEDLKANMENGLKAQNLEIQGSNIVGKGANLDRYTILNTKLHPISTISIVALKSRNVRNIRYFTPLGIDISINSNVSLKSLYNSKIHIANAIIHKESDGVYTLSDSIDDGYKAEYIQLLEPMYRLPKISDCKLDKSGRVFKTSYDEIKRNISSGEEEIHTPLNFINIDVKNLFNQDMIGYRSVQEQYVMGVGHEILISKNKRQIFDIVGLYDKGTLKFLILSGMDNTLEVNDILYIGSGIVRLSSGNRGFTGEDTRIICLGQIGLLVIDLEYNSRMCNIRDMIPYHKMSDKPTLNGLLEEHNIRELFSDRQIEYILEFSRYNNSHMLDIGDFREIDGKKIDSSDDIYNEQGIIEAKQIESIYLMDNDFEILGIDIFGTSTAHEETYYYVYNTDSIVYVQGNLVVNPSKRRDGLIIRSNHGSQRLYLNNGGYLTAELLGIYIMNKLGIIDTISNIFYSITEVDDTVKGIVRSYQIQSNEIVVLLNDVVIRYSISKLIAIYNRILAKQKESEKAINGVNAKTKLIGSGIILDKRGYIVDWEKGTQTELINQVNGILLTSKVRDKDLTLIIDRYIEVSLLSNDEILGIRNVNLILQGDISKYLIDILDNLNAIESITYGNSIILKLDLATSSVKNIAYMLDVIARQMVITSDFKRNSFFNQINYKSYITLKEIFCNCLSFKNEGFSSRHCSIISLTREMPDDVAMGVKRYMISSLMAIKSKKKHGESLVELKSAALKVFKTLASFVFDANEVDKVSKEAKMALENIH